MAFAFRTAAYMPILAIFVLLFGTRATRSLPYRTPRR